jgi:hypothetical protein
MLVDVSRRHSCGKKEHHYWRCVTCGTRLGFLWPRTQSGITCKFCPVCGKSCGPEKRPKYGYGRYKTKGK